MNRELSAFVVAGVSSGVGKTSVSLALCAALAARGAAVQPFKAGPDFLDPTWLAIAAGRACYNLDGWMMGKEYVAALFARATAKADAAVIEGVMGLYDGAAPGSLSGSSAETALITGAPVLLVVDARGMAGSLAALVKGYAAFADGVRVIGVIANNVGSPRHAAILRAALAAAGLPPLLGAIPKGGLPALPSRHLGLVTADRELLSGDTLGKLAAAAEEHIAIGQVMELSRGPRPAMPPEDEKEAPRLRLGVAFDEAFHFYYNDTLEALERRGAAIVRFSPLADAALPEGLDALYIGGGYPEEHAAQLAANASMREAVRAWGAAGRPLYAECGGLIYLSQGVRTRDGAAHRMAGLLPFWTRMRERYRALGYADASLREDALLGAAGEAVRGHRFHYSEIEPFADANGWKPLYAVAPKNGGAPETEGFVKGRTMVSYLHAHLASRPALIENFVQRCLAH